MRGERASIAPRDRTRVGPPCPTRARELAPLARAHGSLSLSAMKLEACALTTTGRRANNEDAVLSLPEVGLFAVADGMGGYEGGEVASQTAIATVHHYAGRTLTGGDVFWPIAPDLARSPTENLVQIASQLAHRRIATIRRGRLAQMGATLALAVASGDLVIIGHIGDSRVYRRHQSRLELLTRDHSLYEQLRAAGADVPPRKQFAHLNVITRALGMPEESGLPELRCERLELGDDLLLCTDGLTEGISDERIAELLAEGSVAAACRRLVEEAFDAGSRDNISAVLVRRVE